jgi:hypothetical protein
VSPYHFFSQIKAFCQHYRREQHVVDTIQGHDFIQNILIFSIGKSYDEGGNDHGDDEMRGSRVEPANLLGIRIRS